MIRIILGFSVAFIALFCFAVDGLLAGKPAFEVCRPYLAGGMAAGGVAAWFMGRVSARRRGAPGKGRTKMPVSSACATCVTGAQCC